MVGQLLSAFSDLNIAIINTISFPDAIAVWFKFHGVKSYVKLSDGPDEFQHGLQCFLDGKNYIAPDVQYILDELGEELPKVPLKETRRQKEILLMLCCGFTVMRIVDKLHICRATVEKHITELVKIFNSRDRAELVYTVNRLEIFTKDELRFYDTSDRNMKLPDWAKTQQRINKLAKSKTIRGIA